MDQILMNQTIQELTIHNSSKLISLFLGKIYERGKIINNRYGNVFKFIDMS